MPRPITRLHAIKREVRAHEWDGTSQHLNKILPLVELQVLIEESIDLEVGLTFPESYFNYTFLKGSDWHVTSVESA